MINIFWGICLTMIVLTDFVNILFLQKRVNLSANDNDIAVLIILALR